MLRDPHQTEKIFKEQLVCAGHHVRGTREGYMLIPVSPKSLQRQPAILGPEPGMGQLCPQHLEHCDMVQFPECGMHKGPMRTASRAQRGCFPGAGWDRSGREAGPQGLAEWRAGAGGYFMQEETCGSEKAQDAGEVRGQRKGLSPHHLARALPLPLIVPPEV